MTRTLDLITGNTATEEALGLLFVCVWEEQLATVSPSGCGSSEYL